MEPSSSGQCLAAMTRFAPDYGTNWAVYASWKTSESGTTEIFNRPHGSQKNIAPNLLLSSG